MAAAPPGAKKQRWTRRNLLPIVSSIRSTGCVPRSSACLPCTCGSTARTFPCGWTRKRSRGKRWGAWGSADTCRSSTEESSCPGKPSEDRMFSPFSNTFVYPSQLLEMVNCNQSTLSHHMKILTDSGLVIARKDWKWVHYSINKEKVELLNNYLK